MIKENPSKRAPNTSDCESIENYNTKVQKNTKVSPTRVPRITIAIQRFNS